MAIDEARLQELLGAAVGDIGSALFAATVLVGDELGLYRGLAEGGPQTPGELAARTATTERYVREWLAAQAAAGYVRYEGGRYSLSPEQTVLLGDQEAPLPGGFLVAAAVFAAIPKVVEAFRTGAGVSWTDHDPRLFAGTERFFRPGYAQNLVPSWIPALDGVEAKLRAGGRVADLGCGHGVSTLILAEAYPASEVVGFDFHAPSIERARTLAAEAGLADRVRFEVATAHDYPGTGYDLVTIFDALHDMGDPLGVARHILSTLAPDGTLMLVEPYANDRLEDNLTPLGKLFYSASTFICTPNALSQGAPEHALGAQAGQARLTEVLREAGFTRVRRATETPFNLILEARP